MQAIAVSYSQNEAHVAQGTIPSLPPLLPSSPPPIMRDAQHLPLDVAAATAVATSQRGLTKCCCVVTPGGAMGQVAYTAAALDALGQQR